jgi:hypothetical protein
MKKVFIFIIFSLFIISPVFAEEDALIDVLDMKFAEKIVNREPVNVSNEFPSNIEKVYCWTKIKAYKVPTFIVHEWYYNGRLMASVKLDIRSPIFRTWSSKRIFPKWKGKWMVLVKDENGSIVASKEFYIK